MSYVITHERLSEILTALMYDSDSNNDRDIAETSDMRRCSMAYARKHVIPWGEDEEKHNAWNIHDDGDMNGWINGDEKLILSPESFPGLKAGTTNGWNSDAETQRVIRNTERAEKHMSILSPESFPGLKTETTNGWFPGMKTGTINGWNSGEKHTSSLSPASFSGLKAETINGWNSGDEKHTSSLSPASFSGLKAETTNGWNSGDEKHMNSLIPPPSLTLAGTTGLTGTYTEVIVVPGKANHGREVKTGKSDISPQNVDNYQSEIDDCNNNVVWDGKPREQPIFSTKAHVFQIDPETKKNWLSLSDHAIGVSFYHDAARNSYRIISVDGSKAVVNSTVSSGMTFTRTSHKFGQWSDPRANTVYGLGFETEPELNKFIEKFKEIKDLTRQKSKTDLNGSLPNDITYDTTHKHTTSSVSSLQSDTSGQERRDSYPSSTTSSTNPPPANSTESHLRYENDRLKLALAQSSANAKKWEVELQTLKNNNARLTTALQESTSNVEEWKKQLTAYKDESARLKKKVLEMEEHQVNEETTTLLEHEVSTLTANLDKSDQEIAAKDDEIRCLNTQLSELMARDALSKSVQAKAQSLEKENQMLSQRLKTCEKQAKDAASLRQKTNEELSTMMTEAGDHLIQSQRLNDQVLAIIRTDGTS